MSVLEVPEFATLSLCYLSKKKKKLFPYAYFFKSQTLHKRMLDLWSSGITSCSVGDLRIEHFQLKDF
jgi:hypothetical protein